MRVSKLTCSLVLAFIALVTMGALTSQVNTYVNGNILTADQLNSEFSNIYATINSLDEANLSSSTSIEPTKLSATLAGDGLARSGSGVLSVNVDGVTVKVVADVVKIEDLPGSALATGAVGSTQIANGGVAKVDLAVKTTAATATVGNVALSSDTGASEVVFNTGTSGDLVNNLVNLTTNGGPVRVSMAAGTSTTSTYLECEDATTDPCILSLARGGVVIYSVPFYAEGGEYRLPPGAFNFIDTPAAGTYEYKITYSVPSATALRILNVRLMAYEL